MASYRVGDWVRVQFNEQWVRIDALDEQWVRIDALDETDSTKPIRCGGYWPFSDDIVEHCEFHSRSET